MIALFHTDLHRTAHFLHHSLDRGSFLLHIVKIRDRNVHECVINFIGLCRTNCRVMLLSCSSGVSETRLQVHRESSGPEAIPSECICSKFCVFGEMCPEGATIDCSRYLLALGMDVLCSQNFGEALLFTSQVGTSDLTAC